MTVRVGNYTTVTDAEGHYKLEGIPAGFHQLQVVFAGEVLTERIVVVVAGRLRNQDIYAVHDVKRRQSVEPQDSSGAREVMKGIHGLVEITMDLLGLLTVFMSIHLKTSS